MYRNLIEKLMKRSLATLLVLALTPSFLFASAFQQKPRHSLAFTHVNVIDMTGASPRADTTVVISEGRIVRLGRTGRTRIPKDAEIIDGRGKFLIPGLWDMHAHLGTDDFDRKGHLALFVANGVTGIRIMDGEPAHHHWRAQIAAGSLVGPRMVIASPIIGQNPIPAADARVAVRQAQELDRMLGEIAAAAR